MHPTLVTVPTKDIGGMLEDWCQLPRRLVQDEAEMLQRTRTSSQSGRNALHNQNHVRDAVCDAGGFFTTNFTTTISLSLFFWTTCILAVVRYSAVSKRAA